MGPYIARRMIYLAVVLLVISAITFILMHAVPGGPFDQEKAVPDAVLANLERRYHLDEPLPLQYLRYISDVILPHFSTYPPKGTIEDDYLININLGKVWIKIMNFGPTYSSRSRTVNDIFRQQLPVSMQLGLMAMFLAIAIGIPLGIMAALKQNTIFDYMGMSLAIIGVSVPVIVLGPMMVWIFAVELGWLPVSGWGSIPPYRFGFLPQTFGWDYFKFAILPVIALGIGSSAIIARLTRATLLQVIREDYIRTARAKGLEEKLVIYRHAFKNSLIPVVTILGPMFAALVTGTFVTEMIFGIPGMGRYFVTSITNRDYPVIMGTILLYAVFLVFSNLVVDLVYGYLDPRIRYD
jgi:ABC-type dipeptide/oligopeptide/nickel transport system permease component